ncbi:MAG: hypothetical protein ACRESK_02905 [Gammaproteobacteria bacterium]
MRPGLRLTMFTTINAVFREFFSICLLQGKPQDLPVSNLLLSLCLVIYTAENVLLALHKVTLIKALEASLLETVLITIITLVILVLSHRASRWQQTLTALIGTGCIMGVLALPIFYGSTLANTDALRAVIFLLYVGLLVWNISIMSHILRHALDTSLVFGVIFALTYIFITSILINLVIPELESA